MTRYYVDPDGDILATLLEPSGPFAPSAQVGEQLPDTRGDGGQPAIGDREDADENAGIAENGKYKIQWTHVEKDAVQTTEPPSEYRLRLSSKHLMLASPYIRKMYSGTWKDSTLRDEDGLLSWDVGALFDPNAFIIVMNIIHGLNRKVPRIVDLELLANIAAITDYLQCHESMDVFSAIWIDGLRGSLPDTYSRELILWIMVSFIFRDQKAFGRATRTAILNAREEVPSVGLPIHQIIISMMEESRQVHLDTLLDTLYGATKRLRAGICDDGCDSMLLGSLIRQVKAVDLLQQRQHGPIHGLSVAGVAADIAKFSTPSWYHPTDVETSVGYDSYGYAKSKKVKKKKKFFSLPNESDEDPAQMEDSREGHPCTLDGLFREIQGLEAGVQGLDLEAILG